MRLPNVLDEQWFPRRCLRSFFEMQGLDRAMVIASQAFTALIPLIILASALLPTENHDSMADAIVRKFALTGDAATAVHTVFAPTGEATIGLISILLLVFSGVSLTRRIQRMYLERLAAAAHPERPVVPLRRGRAGCAHPRARAALGHPLAAAPDPVRLGAGAQRVAGVERRRVDLHPVAAAEPTGRLAAAAAGRHPRRDACAPRGATSRRCTCRG